MAVDAQEMMRRIQQLQAQAGPRPMAGIPTPNADAAREAGGLQAFLADPLGIGAYKRSVRDAEAIDQSIAQQAATQQQRVESAPGMGQVARLMGIDPQQPGVGEAYGKMVASGIAPEAALSQLAANPQINPAVAQAQASQQLTGEIQTRTDMAKMQSAELAAMEAVQGMQPSQFGSGIDDYQTFQTVAEPIGASFRGAENVGFIADAIENLTPAQIAESGEIKGELQAAGYQLLSAMQSLSENKASTLREGERKLIQDFLGNPDSFFSGMFSRDPVTLGKLRKVQDAFERNLEGGLVGLDATTIGLLEQSAMRPDPRMRRFKTPEGVTREPQLPTISTEGISPIERMRLRDEDLR